MGVRRRAGDDWREAELVGGKVYHDVLAVVSLGLIQNRLQARHLGLHFFADTFLQLLTG